MKAWVKVERGKLTRFPWLLLSCFRPTCSNRHFTNEFERNIPAIDWTQIAISVAVFNMLHPPRPFIAFGSLSRWGSHMLCRQPWGRRCRMCTCVFVHAQRENMRDNTNKNCQLFRRGLSIPCLPLRMTYVHECHACRLSFRLDFLGFLITLDFRVKNACATKGCARDHCSRNKYWCEHWNWSR